MTTPRTSTLLIATVYHESGPQGINERRHTAHLSADPGHLVRLIIATECSIFRDGHSTPAGTTVHEYTITAGDLVRFIEQQGQPAADYTTRYMPQW